MRIVAGADQPSQVLQIAAISSWTDIASILYYIVGILPRVMAW
jgi:hypothetical protein